MWHLISRRLLRGIPMVLVVSLLTFVLVSLSPGNPAVTLLGTNATQAQYAAVDRQLGLNRPLWSQYWQWLSGAFRGHLGTSLYSSQPVTSILGSRLIVTLTLVILATLLSAIAGIALGVVSSLGSRGVSRTTDVISMLGFAIPNFWLGLILILVFAEKLHLLPATGWIPFSASPSGWLRSLILPVVTLAAAGATGIAKQTRDSMKDQLSQEYIFALRATGISERTIVFKHALRNASIPVVTVIGLFFVGMLGGTVLVEQIFALPGLGSAAVSATSTHDLPVIQGVAICFAIIVVIVNLIIEVAYGWLNPKARTR
jgi:peptide/nickel transport system permease protein